MSQLVATPAGYPLFTEEQSAEAVNARIGDDVDPRFRTVMAALVKHLHAAVKEIEPTHDEWMKAICFLTETGQMCSDWRQEFVLLSDALGVSMLVETINHRRSGGATENTVLGPFHVEGAPFYANGDDIRLDGKGEAMLVCGRVVDIQGHPVANALLDIWQTNDDGFYDVQQPEVQPQWNLRGRFHSGSEGEYAFLTSRPRFYPLPYDGTVGKMLARLGRHPNRAAHIHFIVTAPGFDPVITHIFDPDCPYLTEDTVFGVKPSLIAPVRPAAGDAADHAKGVQPVWQVDWDFVLAEAKPG